jgi:hypothetical protein
MDKLQQLTRYINRIISDDRLTPVHISLCMALCHTWVTSQFQLPFRISRRLLMRASRIRSKATYHKIIWELQLFGYLQYFPSYHPINASRVIILVNDASV